MTILGVAAAFLLLVVVIAGLYQEQWERDQEQYRTRILSIARHNLFMERLDEHCRLNIAMLESHLRVRRLRLEDAAAKARKP